MNAGKTESEAPLAIRIALVGERVQSAAVSEFFAKRRKLRLLSEWPENSLELPDLIVVAGRVQALSALRNLPPTVSRVPRLWISSGHDEVNMRELLRLGLVGCLPAEFSLAEFEAAALAALNGRTFFPTDQILNHFRADEPAANVRGVVSAVAAGGMHVDSILGTAALTDREREIVQALCEGKREKEIASVLGISNFTVHTHLKNIYKKLEVHSRRDAIQKFLRKI